MSAANTIIVYRGVYRGRDSYRRRKLRVLVV
jgi:hypothetical protein